MHRFGLRSLQSAARGHRPLAAVQRSQRLYPLGTRAKHYPVKLPYDAAEGLGNFMKSETITQLSTEYQRGLLARLDNLIKDTPAENQSLLTALVSFAEDRTKTMEFAYAAQALNNSFFLDQLKPPPPTSAPENYGHEEEVYHSARFLGSVNHSFGSLAGLKSTFSAAAEGMFGTGWVWLVADDSGTLAVTATFGAGTMLVRSRAGMNAPTAVHGVDPDLKPKDGTPVRPFTPKGYIGISRSPLDDIDRMTEMQERNLVPLLVCSVHEHCWLRDHGIWGKDDYMTNFWEVVDWAKVTQTWNNLYDQGRRIGAATASYRNARYPYQEEEDD